MNNFIAFTIRTRRAQIALWLFISIMFSFALLAVRIHYTGTTFFRFLVWNLFLAFIPYIISLFLSYYAHRRHTPAVIVAGAAGWLLFFPNAPYILTDLFHLYQRPGIPLWYDLVLILSFAWNGLMLAYVSLADMQSLIRKTFNKLTGNLFVLAAMGLTGFGIYLGRFLRWNSWDILTNPTGLAYDIASRFRHPFMHGRTWYITFAFFVFLSIGYFTIKQLAKATVQR